MCGLKSPARRTRSLRQAEQDLAWRRKFEAVFAELNTKTATVDEGFLSFTQWSADARFERVL